MKFINSIKNVYFLGIGGIGMSALAQFFVLNGKNVAGYDRIPGEMTEKLQAIGISVIFEDKTELIPEEFMEKSETLIVYTPAIPDDLGLFNFFRDKKYNIRKRARVLGDVSRGLPTLAVAGTHGKTTTSALLAHLLKQSGYKITAFLGGVLENYHSNFIGDGHDACVVEADEFDHSFLELYPEYAAVNSMDADHLDIYGKHEELLEAFHEFAGKVSIPERLFFKKGLPLAGNSVAVNEVADYYIENIRVENAAYHFDFVAPHDTLIGLKFNLPGRHNLMNAAVALSMALSFGAKPRKLAAALADFKGVERRFTYHLKSENLVLVEDYAHHPAELSAVLQAAREMHPNKKIVAIFQPHLYTRTRDFADEFAESLSLYDEVILLPVYPAREEPIPGIDSAYLLSLIENPKKSLVQKDELPGVLKEKKNVVLMMMGAGNIGNEVPKVKRAIKA